MIRFFLICFCLVFSAQTSALSISLGANLAKHELLAVENNEESKLVAQFSSEIYATPSIHINTSPNYFGNTRFGWLVEFNIGFLDIEQPPARMQGETYQPNVTGSFGHLNPVVFYRFGDKQRKGTRNWHLTTGLGYGLSFISLNGSFITTELSEEEQKRVEIDNAQGFFLLPAVIFDYNYNNWFVNMTACFGGEGFEVDDHVYLVRFRSVGVGYSFEI